MEEVIIGFSSHRGFNIISWLIRLFEGTPYSHVYVKWYSKAMDRWLVYHANRDNLNFQNWPNFKKDNIVIEEWSLLVSKAQRREIMQYCVDTVHRKYGVWNLIGILLVRLAAKVGWTINKNPFRDSDRSQICSELGCHVANIAGASISQRDMELEGPRFLHGVISMMPNVKLV